MPGHFVGRIKGDKYRFDLQYLTWDFSSSSPFAFNLSQHQVAKVLKLQPTPLSWLFASGGQSIKSFSFSISPSNDYSGLISFRADWFDLLALQGTLKSLFQHHSSKASILWCSGFMVQLSHSYLTTGKP